MRVITLAGSPRYPSRSSALLEYARETLTAADIEVCHWHLQNFAPEDLLYARFDNPALQTLNEQLAGADGLIIATPVYKDRFTVVVPQTHPFAARPHIALSALGDEPLIVLIHREEIVVVARPFGRIPLQLMNHGAGRYFLIRLTQLSA